MKHRKVVRFCSYTKEWFVWDRVLKAQRGYFHNRSEALFWASQLELF